MKKILVTGALGQIGSELVMYLRKIYGYDRVMATDKIKRVSAKEVLESGPYETVDVTDGKGLRDVIERYKPDIIIHLAALLSATGEKNPQLAWEINMNGLYNVLEIAKDENLKVFTPSSIAAFGPSTPKVKTPQDTIQRPTTMYGVTKVAGELLSDYYFYKYGVDTRGVRFPGLISYQTLPGGGTTDYAVHIYYEAIKARRYNCYIAKGTYMDMMYMPDALGAIVKLLEADPLRLKHRNAFNITAMSFEPEDIYCEIKKHIPDFVMTYDVDPVRQGIAESWPDSLDDTEAREEWDWNPEYDLKTMTEDMIEKLKLKLL